METKIPLYRVWENNLIPSTTRLSFRRPPDHGGVLSMSSPSRSHIYNRTQQDSFHGELVWKNHDSRLLMKSRFMRKKKLAIHESQKYPLPNEPPAESEGIFHLKTCFDEEANVPPPTRPQLTLFGIFCICFALRTTQLTLPTNEISSSIRGGKIFCSKEMALFSTLRLKVERS